MKKEWTRLNVEVISVTEIAKEIKANAFSGASGCGGCGSPCSGTYCGMAFGGCIINSP